MNNTFVTSNGSFSSRPTHILNLNRSLSGYSNNSVLNINTPSSTTNSPNFPEDDGNFNFNSTITTPIDSEIDKEYIIKDHTSQSMDNNNNCSISKVPRLHSTSKSLVVTKSVPKKLNSACHLCDHPAQRPHRSKIVQLIACHSLNCRKVFCSRPACARKLNAVDAEGDAIQIIPEKLFIQWRTRAESGEVPQFICPHCTDEPTCPGPQCRKRQKVRQKRIEKHNNNNNSTNKSNEETSLSTKQARTVNYLPFSNLTEELSEEKVKTEPAENDEIVDNDLRTDNNSNPLKSSHLSLPSLDCIESITSFNNSCIPFPSSNNREEEVWCLAPVNYHNNNNNNNNKTLD